MKTGMCYRSARPDEASAADRVYLARTLGIKTIVDLRSKTEQIKAGQKHVLSASRPAFHSETTPQPGVRAGASLQIPGIRYAMINLNGEAFERALLWQLKYTSLIRLLWLMACGYREDAIGILGREVMQPRGLVGLGVDTLDYSTSEIRDVFLVLAKEENYPVFLHCTQGKDRTGLVILLVLMLCGVDHDAIAEDYMRSEEQLETEKEERVLEILRIGLSEEFAHCPGDFVREVERHLQERYGGVDKYMTGIGVDLAAQECLRKIMLPMTAQV